MVSQVCQVDLALQVMVAWAFQGKKVCQDSLVSRVDAVSQVSLALVFQAQMESVGRQVIQECMVFQDVLDRQVLQV